MSLSSKVLVLGGTGLLGSALVYQLRQAGIDHGFTSRKPRPSQAGSVAWLWNVDGGTPERALESIHRLRTIVRTDAYDYVVNCLDGSMKTATTYMNAWVPALLDNQLYTNGTRNPKVIHISTNAMFDSRLGYNLPETLPSTQTAYEISKLAGERPATQMVVRTSFIGLPFYDDRCKLVDAEKIKTSDSNILWNGTTNLAVARWIAQQIIGLNRWSRGIHHLEGQELEQRQIFQLLMDIFKVAGTPALTTCQKLLCGEVISTSLKQELLALRELAD